MGGQVMLANMMEVEMVYEISANVFPGIRFLCANTENAAVAILAHKVETTNDKSTRIQHLEHYSRPESPTWISHGKLFSCLFVSLGFPFLIAYPTSN